MSWPTPVDREPLHTLSVTFEGYARGDGLWDIEAHLRDTKPFFFEVPGENQWQPGEPIHDLRIRLTLDSQFVVQDIAMAMNRIPHDTCPQALPPMRGLIGSSLLKGWRRTLEAHLGGVQGCTHMRELLFNMGTAAFQSIGPRLRRANPDKAPPHLGRCKTWALDTPLVQRLYPLHYQPNPLKD